MPNYTNLSSGYEKRRSFFDIYSKNLELCKQHPRIELRPDVDDVCICPICMKFFPREALIASDEYDDHLTLEDIPPLALGGKVRTLTCKICNNRGGSELESHLKRMLLFENALKGEGQPINGTLRSSNDIKLTASVHIQGIDQLYIQYHPDLSNPQHVDTFEETLESGQIGEFSIDLKGRYIQNRSEIALLRIGYLIAYSTFGFGFLANFNLGIIRKQIQEPEIKLVKNWGCSSVDYPDDFLGVNLITHPIELRSFLVVFDLVTDTNQKRFGVLLPGPTEPAISIYDFISKKVSNEEEVHFSALHIPHNNYLTDESLVFAPHIYWNSTGFDN